MRVNRIKGFQPYDRFIERHYHQMMESMLSIGERSAQLGSRIDRALTITHALQQRKFTQYALFATVIFSIFSGLSALGGGIKAVYHDINQADAGAHMYRDLAVGGVSSIIIVLIILLWRLTQRNLTVMIELDRSMLDRKERDDINKYTYAYGFLGIVVLVVVFLLFLNWHPIYNLR